MRAAVMVASAPLVIGSVAVAVDGVAADAARRPPYEVTPPDLQILVPMSAISIGANPDTGDQQLQFTHITWNAGAGPFVIKPHYTHRTGTATFKQIIYKSRGGAAWRPAFSVPLSVTGVFDPPSDYRYPLTRFTLNVANSDGTPSSTIVATSPKTDYCITSDATVGGVANMGNPYPPQSDCTSPNKPLGLSPGYGDQYDQTDNGQPIDLTGVADGTYVLQATVDPQHIFTESDPDNNVVDTLLQISGNDTSVNVISQTGPGSNGPAILTSSRTAAQSSMVYANQMPVTSATGNRSVSAVIVNPWPGETVSGSVPVAASFASGESPISVQFTLDGRPLGAPDTAKPYAVQWDTRRATAGAHELGVVGTWPGGVSHSAPPVDVVVHNPAPAMTCFVLEAHARGKGGATTSSAPVRTVGGPTTLLALVVRNGPGATLRRVGTLRGAGLRWRLVRHAHAGRAAVEIWSASTSNPIAGASVTSASPDSRDTQQFDVIAMEGVEGVGASAASSGSAGAPAVRLVTTGATPALVFAVGGSQHASRVLHAGWVRTDGWTDAADTAWSVYTNQPTLHAGTVVTAPGPASGDGGWAMASVELVGDGS